VSSVSGAHRDSRIEGLEGTRGRLDSVTDDVVGGSSEGIGEGPGKYSGTGLMDRAAGTGGIGTSADRSNGNSTDEGEGLDTGSGCRTSPAVPLEETDGMSVGELIVGRSSGR
jgi:hypothetical protein